MDTRNNSITPQNQEAPLPPSFKPFHWMHQADVEKLGPRAAQLLEHAQDIAAGTAILAQMIEQNRLANESSDDAPLIGFQESADLLRHIIASNELLRDAIETVWPSA